MILLKIVFWSRYLIFMLLHHQHMPLLNYIHTSVFWSKVFNVVIEWLTSLECTFLVNVFSDYAFTCQEWWFRLASECASGVMLPVTDGCFSICRDFLDCQRKQQTWEKHNRLSLYLFDPWNYGEIFLIFCLLNVCMGWDHKLRAPLSVTQYS